MYILIKVNCSVYQSLPTDTCMCACSCASSIPRGTFNNSASSCHELVQQIQNFQPGYFWVESNEQTPQLVYCTATTECCNEPGGWMRVAYVDMTNLDHKCPSGFDVITSPKRLCRRKVTPGCTSVTYSVHNIEYTKVCGRVRGYQDTSTDGFKPYYLTSSTLNGTYVDGVSITHGNIRQHIWTFAAGYRENEYAPSSCPCARNDHAFTGQVPPFIMNNYFCESAHRESRIIAEDPLWDGMDCPSGNTCCSERNPPWFCTTVAATTEDIEVRVCTDQARSDEDVLLEVVELYVQ